MPKSLISNYRSYNYLDGLAYPKGDGIFEEDERDFYLEMARKAIAYGIANQTFYESLLSEFKQNEPRI